MVDQETDQNHMDGTNIRKKIKSEKIKNWGEISQKDFRNPSGIYPIIIGYTDQSKSFGKSLTLCILKMPSGLSCQWAFKIFHPYDYGLLNK